jgi:hypothetical protein
MGFCDGRVTFRLRTSTASISLKCNARTVLSGAGGDRVTRSTGRPCRTGGGRLCRGDQSYPSAARQGVRGDVGRGRGHNGAGQATQGGTQGRRAGGDVGAGWAGRQEERRRGGVGDLPRSTNRAGTASVSSRKNARRIGGEQMGDDGGRRRRGDEGSEIGSRAGAEQRGWRRARRNGRSRRRRGRRRARGWRAG